MKTKMTIKEMKHTITATLVLATMLITPSLFGHIPSNEPPLPITAFKDLQNDTAEVNWHDYRHIVGWRLYSATDLQLGDWVLEDEGPLSTLGTTVAMTDPQRFYRLHAFKGNNGGYDFPIWEKVDHTIMINLNTFAVTKLPRDFNVTNDVASATDHLYLRYINACPEGFTMGSPANEFGRISAFETQTEMFLTSGFYISVYPITDHQYNRVMNGTTGAKTPKTSISWRTLRGKIQDNNPAPAEVLADPSGATSFLWQLKDKVSKGSSALTLAFDLPTETQWEYACRAETQGTFSFLPTEIITNVVGKAAAQYNSDLLPVLGGYAWYKSNSDDSVEEVGTRLPNPAGLYDMHGNIVEACRDAYDAPSPDLPGPSASMPDRTDRLYTNGIGRVIRGGSWLNDASFLRSARRSSASASQTSPNNGFRLCATGAPVP